MYKLNIKREKQSLNGGNLKINVLINEEDLGVIKSGETKTFEVNQSNIDLEFKQLIRSTKLKLKLTKDEDIAIKWNKKWGYIEVDANKEIIIEEKRKISAKNIFLYILFAIFWIIIYYSIWG